MVVVVNDSQVFMTPSSRTCVCFLLFLAQIPRQDILTPRHRTDRGGISKGALASIQRWSESFLLVLLPSHQAQEQSDFHCQITPFCLASFFPFIYVEHK